MKDSPTIECRPNGPYLVKNLEVLGNSKGERLPCQPVMALCRCGGSASKPFCDGTHKRIGFSGARLSDGSSDRRDSYRGRRITIIDNRAICAHAGRCTDGLAAVFKYGSDPWIDPDGASAEAIIETIRSCPSGALSYSLDEVEASLAARAPAVTVSRNGPYEVVGMRLSGESQGAGASAEHFTLCRCGGSKNKPFCDGTHDSIGFKDDGN